MSSYILSHSYGHKYLLIFNLKRFTRLSRPKNPNGWLIQASTRSMSDYLAKFLQNFLFQSRQKYQIPYKITVHKPVYCFIVSEAPIIFFGFSNFILAILSLILAQSITI